VPSVAVSGKRMGMSIGPNMKRVGVWSLAFLAAQGMVYHWGYESGYLSGHRQGYGDVWREAENKAWSDETIRQDTATAAAANGRQAMAGNGVVAE
jgi:hypothetical protein